MLAGPNDRSDVEKGGKSKYLTSIISDFAFALSSYVSYFPKNFQLVKKCLID